MHVLIYLHSLGMGGAERVVANLANHWAEKGWKVTMVTVAPCNADFYKLDARIQRFALGLVGETKKVITSLLRNLRRIGRLRAILKQAQPDIALGVMSNANVVLALASRGMPSLCTVGSEHTCPAHVSLGVIWGGLRRQTYRRLDAVVALTSECAHWLNQHAVAPRVPVIPNAAIWPLPTLSPRVVPLTLCAPERKILLAVGRLCAEKNFEALISAFSQLATKYPEWDLVILGKGPDRDTLESQVDDAGLQGRVILAGVVGNMDEWYERADLYVMSSRLEGFPNTLVEAMAHGLPAVSFDCDTGPRDIIRHGTDGLLVQAGDVRCLISALDQVMGDDVLRARLAARATEARDRFSIERVSAMWEELFRDCMAGKARYTDAQVVRGN